jgi:hypothetical protein
VPKEWFADVPTNAQGSAMTSPLVPVQVPGFYCRECGSMYGDGVDCYCWHQCAECPERHRV